MKSSELSVQQGGALVETLVLCLVMSPLVFLIPMIGNITDLTQTTIQASRYVAWEQTVAVDQHSTKRVKGRFFDDPEAGIQSTPQQRLGDPQGSRLWNVAGGEAGPAGNTGNHDILVSFSNGGGHYLDSDTGQTATARTFGTSVQRMGSALGFLDNVDWDLEGDGTVDAGVRVNLLSTPFLNHGGVDCNGRKTPGVFNCVSAHNTIMIDGWGVAQNTKAENRTRALVPGALLFDAGNALSLLGENPVFSEFSGLNQAFGHIDSSRLPLDRYSGTYRRAE